MVILLFLLVSSYGAWSYPTGRCTKIDSSGRMEWFCCDNHEEVNGNCIKCVNGYESVDGGSCVSCPTGLWGEQCANRCSCTQPQICDHRLGCISIQINMPEETTVKAISGPTDRLKFTSTTTECIWFTTFLSHSIKPFTIRRKISTFGISARRTTSTTSRPNENDKGFHREIIIYSICAGTFAFVILLCTVCQRRYKQIYNFVRRNTTANRGERNIQENVLPEIPLEESEGIYEVIDESNMIDDFETIENIDDTASSNENHCPLDNDG